MSTNILSQASHHTYTITEEGGLYTIIDEVGKQLGAVKARRLVLALSQAFPRHIDLYVFFNRDDGLTKVGISHTANMRRKQLGSQLQIVNEFTCRHYVARELEHFIHFIFELQGKRRHGEWFALTEIDKSIFRVADLEVSLIGCLQGYVDTLDPVYRHILEANIPEPVMPMDEFEIKVIADYRAGIYRRITISPESLIPLQRRSTPPSTVSEEAS